MKFEDFELDLTKILKGYGVNPLDNGCDDISGGSGGDGFTSSMPPSVEGGHVSIRSNCVTCDNCESQKFTCLTSLNC